jgi:hypothetical protein
MEIVMDDQEWEDFVAARQWLKEALVPVEMTPDMPLFVDEPTTAPDVIECELEDAPICLLCRDQPIDSNGQRCPNCNGTGRLAFAPNGE